MASVVRSDRRSTAGPAGVARVTVSDNQGMMMAGRARGWFAEALRNIGRVPQHQRATVTASRPLGGQ